MTFRICKQFLGALVLAFWSIITVTGQSFEGQVIDSESNKPIEFANVYLLELETGTSTNSEGRFSLDKLPSRQLNIQISSVGYLTLLTEINPDNLKENIFYLEPSHVELEEVVISIPGGKLQGDNITSVDRKKIVDLSNTASETLAEALSNLPGIDQKTTGSGIGKPVIRGLTGNRIITYSQNVRVENQQWGDEHGLGIGAVGIESVEVIKGPASLLYGSDALGGVIYFVEEKYAQQQTMEGFAKTMFLSNTLGTYTDAGFKVNTGHLKLNVFGNYTSNVDYKIPDNKRVFNTRFDEKNLKSSLGYNHKNWISNLRFSYIENHFGIPDSSIYSNSTSRSTELPFQTVSNNTVSFENSLLTGKSKWNLVLGYSNNKRQEFEESKSEAELDMRLNTSSYNLKWHSPLYSNIFQFIAGSQGMYQVNKNKGEEILIPDATTSDLGGFFIANYYAGPVHIQGGLRADGRWISTEKVEDPDLNIPSLDRSFGSVNYSLGASLNINNSTFRANLSSGFRAPNTSELLSYGVHEGTNRFEIGNPNLKSENALQFDLTYQYQDDHFSFSINPFINSISNYIYLSPTDTIIEDRPVYEYLQTDAILFGGEMGFHFHPHSVHWLHIESNISTVFAEDREGNPLPLIPPTRLNTTIKAEFKKSKKVYLKDIFIQHLFKFEQDRVSTFESQTPSYNLFNLGCNVGLNYKSPLMISAGVKNLFNTSYIDHLSRLKPLEIPNQGINFYLSLKLSFNQSIKG